MKALGKVGCYGLAVLVALMASRWGLSWPGYASSTPAVSKSKSAAVPRGAGSFSLPVGRTGTKPAGGDNWRQLSYASVTDEALGLPPDLRRGQTQRELSAAIPDRRIPPLSRFSELTSPRLRGKAIPLPQANTLAHLSYQQRRFGRLVSEAGETSLFNPQTILVKFQGARHVAALRVEPMREWEAVRVLKQRLDVEFAELDIFQRRQFSPNDPELSGQWHHMVIGSPQAWDKGLGQSFVRIAIVDTPFQMNHPDLAPNSVSGWDVVANVPVTSSTGILHSTMCAGMAAAVVNNALGVAGAVNCAILPININGAISEMYNATIWAADHGVRVVNLSWTGGNSDTVEAAAAYLKTISRGILAMAGVNGSGYLNYTNQPDIYCISMTDAADNLQSMHGPHIDFAAPGWQILSTTTGGGYAIGTGTSYSTPLFCGVVAWLFSLNPTLGPDEAIGILENTALDLGSPGWDQYFGWGRIRFNDAAIAAAATLPAISAFAGSTNSVVVSTTFRPGFKYNLWRTDKLVPPAWSSVTNVAVTTNGTAIVLTDLSPSDPQAFYRIEASLP